MTSEIRQLESQINSLDAGERVLGHLSPEAAGRRIALRSSLARAYEDERRRFEAYEGICRRTRSQARTSPCEAPRSALVPMGMDQHVGTGRNAGFLMEDGKRTRKL
jgi:hypothetical protein